MGSLTEPAFSGLTDQWNLLVSALHPALGLQVQGQTRFSIEAGDPHSDPSACITRTLPQPSFHFKLVRCISKNDAGQNH